MSGKDTDEEDRIEVCPDCSSSSISLNSAGGPSKNRDAKQYRCSDCYNRFDEPEVRERQGESKIRGDSLASKLADADADELVTDGGQDTEEVNQPFWRFYLIVWVKMWMEIIAAIAQLFVMVAGGMLALLWPTLLGQYLHGSLALTPDVYIFVNFGWIIIGITLIVAFLDADEEYSK